MRNRLQFALLPLVGLGIALSGMIVMGCNEGKERMVVQAGPMLEYTDPGIGFSIQYPEGWIVSAKAGRAYFYNDPHAEQRFLDPRGSHADGAVIAVTAKKANDVAAAIEKFRGELAESGSVLGREEPVMIGKYQGIRLPYTARFEAQNVVQGYHILVAADSVLYDLGVAGFGDRFDAYTLVFEASLGSFQFPEQHARGASGL